MPAPLVARGARPRILQAGRLLPDLEQALGLLIDVARRISEPERFVRHGDWRRPGRIAGAGLAVFEDEPRLPSALFRRAKLGPTPHTASRTHETRRAMGQRVIDKLDAFFRDGTLVSAAP